MLDTIDKKIIAALQDEFPLTSQPYKQLAEQIGITEDELLARLQRYLSDGTMRRMGAVLRHREAGFTANALCVWRVAEERLDEVAAVMAADQAVTHCYERISYPDWPYNFYTMLHGTSRGECEEIAERLARMAGLTGYKLLFSVKEWKKTSMNYF